MQDFVKTLTQLQNRHGVEGAQLFCLALAGDFYWYDYGSGAPAIDNLNYVATANGGQTRWVRKALSVSGATVSIQGTTNQILANGTTGTPQFGAVILTLPQNIGIGSSPTFSALTLSNPLTGANGGTGVNNSGKTITLGGNLTTSGVAFVSNSNTGDQLITLTGDVTGSGTGSFTTTISNNVVNDTKIASHTSTKITITTKGQLNSAIVYTDQANTYGAFDQTFKAANLKVVDSSDATKILTFLMSGQTTAKTLTLSSLLTTTQTLQIPNITTTDTLMTLGLSQTITAAKTFNDSTILVRNPANTFSYTLKSSAILANRQLNLPLTTQTETIAVQPQAVQAQPADPTGTASTIGVMMGLGVNITPRVTGRLLVLISGQITNNTSNDGAQAQIRIGTGTNPTNGAALTGTAYGSQPDWDPNTGGVLATFTGVSPFSLNAIVPSLTVGTQIWIDLSLAAIAGGTASVGALSVSVLEL